MRRRGIELSESQTSELRALEDGPDEEISRRARIILLLGEGRSIRDVAREAGVSTSCASATITTLELNHWQEIEWLQNHGWEVGA